MKTFTATYVTGILALLFLILTNVNGSPNLSNTPPDLGVIDNIYDMIRNQTRACENLDSKLNRILQKQEELMEALLAHHPGTSLAHPASSCKNVLEFDPTASSGYYYIGSETGDSHHMYCDMTRRCGADKGSMDASDYIGYD